MKQTVRSLMLTCALLFASTALANDPAPAPAQASPPKLMRMGGCAIEEVKPEPCPDPKKKGQATAGGLQKVSMRMPLDPGVAGAWALQPASEKSGIAGTLVITDGGQFRWTKDGKAVAEGPADEVKPPQGAKASARYWRVATDKDEYYFAVEGGALALYSAKDHAKVATGTPRK